MKKVLIWGGIIIALLAGAYFLYKAYQSSQHKTEDETALDDPNEPESKKECRRKCRRECKGSGAFSGCRKKCKQDCFASL